MGAKSTYRLEVSPVAIKSNGSYHVAICILVVIGIMAILAPVLSSSVPLYSDCDGKVLFPALSNKHERIYLQQHYNASCKTLKAPLSHSPNDLDRKALVQAPSSRHFLGTDPLGRDVLSNLLYGMRTALLVVIGSLLIASLFGLFYGLISGYYGDHRLRFSLQVLISVIVSAAAMIYSLCYAWFLFATSNILLGLLLIVLAICIGICCLLWNSKRPKPRLYTFPVDQLFMRFVDGFRALPALIFILSAMYVIDTPGMKYLICLIAILMWPIYARHARVETMRLRNLDRIKSAILSGKSESQIWFSSLVPFVVRPLLVAIAFGCSSVIILESTLSFIGIGIYHEHPSWGQMISAARDHLHAWWLWLFPGLMIMMLIWTFHEIGRYWEEKLTQTSGFRKFGDDV